MVRCKLRSGKHLENISLNMNVGGGRWKPISREVVHSKKKGVKLLLQERTSFNRFLQCLVCKIVFLYNADIYLLKTLGKIIVKTSLNKQILYLSNKFRHPRILVLVVLWLIYCNAVKARGCHLVNQYSNKKIKLILLSDYYVNYLLLPMSWLSSFTITWMLWDRKRVWMQTLCHPDSWTIAALFGNGKETMHSITLVCQTSGSLYAKPQEALSFLHFGHY